jgi:hypothetical protein
MSTQEKQTITALARAYEAARSGLCLEEGNVDEAGRPESQPPVSRLAASSALLIVGDSVKPLRFRGVCRDVIPGRPYVACFVLADEDGGGSSSNPKEADATAEAGVRRELDGVRYAALLTGTGAEIEVVILEHSGSTCFRRSQFFDTYLLTV